MPTPLGGIRDIYNDAGAGTYGPSPVREDISDVIDAIDPREIPFLSVLGFGQEAGAAAGADSLRFPCIKPQHAWLNDELVPSVSLVVSSSGSPVTSIVVTTGEGAFFSVGDIVMVPGATNSEMYHFRVTVVSTDTLTVVQADNTDSTPTLIASAQTIYLLGNSLGEGILHTDLTSKSTQTTQTTNFTQIFMDVVRVAGSWESTEQYGIDNPFDRETDKKIKETVIKLERAAHYGRRTATTFPTADAAVGGAARRMGGLWHYIWDASGTNKTDAAGGALTESRLIDLLQDIWTDGGKPDTVWVGARQKRALNNFLVPFVRTERTENTAGIIVGNYESDFGDVKVVLDRYVHPSDLVITTNEYIGIGPLKGNGKSRAFSIEKLPRRGDLDEAQIIGEYTMEVRNNTRAHGWLYELATS